VCFSTRLTPQVFQDSPQVDELEEEKEETCSRTLAIVINHRPGLEVVFLLGDVCHL
jgi:hypothetical protein